MSDVWSLNDFFTLKKFVVVGCLFLFMWIDFKFMIQFCLFTKFEEYVLEKESKIETNFLAICFVRLKEVVSFVIETSLILIDF